MAETGVLEYMIGTATVHAVFPVNLKGDADIRCSLCQYYRYSSRRCGLNERVCEYPDKYIASHCPLTFEELETEEF